MYGSEFLIADQLWFDRLENLADAGSRFSAANMDPPPGWAHSQFDGWIAWQPEEIELPGQGWKIHVSVQISEADDTVSIVRDYCVAHRLAFKFLRSREIFLIRNEKRAPRAASGKLCAIYPVDDLQLEQTLRELSAALAGRCGPYILSDLRWGPGPLYLRYGAFLPQQCVSAATGDFVLAVRTPDGELVPDTRAPVFRVPPWAPVPAAVADQIAAAARSVTRLPYRVEQVLQYSNGGGVYRAADPATGRAVVIREARPGAGLDGMEADAVSRLRREREILHRLAGLDIAPAFLDYFTCWEHHYLVEEYLDGQVLQHAIAERYPLTRPDPADSDIAEYTRWARAVIQEIERALEAVHERRVIFGDLHPFNIILRPDGRIALVDFEESRDVTDQRGAALGVPGFVPAWRADGMSGDEYALNCVRLSFFFPLTPLLSLDPGRAPDMVRVAADRFGLPAGFSAGLASGLAPPATWDGRAWLARRPGLGPAIDSGRPTSGREPAPEGLIASMTAAIMASATPGRPDRLFPGDPRQFAEGGVSIAHGAAGVLYALSAAGRPVLPEHVDWLSRAAFRWRLPLPGAYSGLGGVAAVLAMLGRRDEALELSDQAGAGRRQIRRIGLYDGLAGAGLALLALADLTGEPDLAREAATIGECLAVALRDPGPATVIAGKPGLMHGWTGVAAFFLGLHALASEERYLALAVDALRLDLARCAPTRSGGLQVRDGARMILYLATGSSGIAVITQAILRHRHHPELAAAREQILPELRAEFIMFPGLFEGRAGILLANSVLRGGQGTTNQHLRCLGWHELSYRSHLAFPGNGLQRLSMDFATGTAGVLFAVHAATAPGTAELPLLGVVRPERLPASSGAGHEREGDEGR